MSNDLIEKAEALCEQIANGRFEWQPIKQIVPELFAEVNRLRAICEAKDFGLSGTANEVYRLQGELAAKDAEICVMKTEACAANKNIKRRDDDINRLMKELVRWQEIAIEATASRNWYKSTLDDLKICYIRWASIPGTGCNIPLLDYWKEYREQAARELGIRISQETSYLDRLEADYLSWVQAYYRDLGEEVAMQRAQNALEKIRHVTD